MNGVLNSNEYNSIDITGRKKGLKDFQKFLDENQYTRKGILKYERVYGHTWISHGGEASTKEIVLYFNLKPGQRVLDIGTGTGGSAFYLARQYGVYVHAVDVASNTLAIAKERLEKEEDAMKERIKFENLDVTTAAIPPNSYDAILSKGVFLHIKDKEGFFPKMLPWLKPGGKLVVWDRCRGNQEHSKTFNDHNQMRGHDLRIISEYADVLRNAGFSKVEPRDNTLNYLRSLESEIRYLKACKESFVKEFSLEDYEDILQRWVDKMNAIKDGDLKNGIFDCQK